MKNRLEQVISQKISINTNIVQSLKVLHTNRMELEEMAEIEATSNPLLEVEIDKGVDWEQYFKKTREAYIYDKNESSYKDDSEYNFENLAKSYDSLYDSLHGQINTMYMPPNKKIICNYLIDSLDKDGYLRENEQTISELLEVDEALISECIGIIQSLEPHGIGARDLKECMIIQIRNDGIENDVLEKIILNDLNLVANLDIKKLSSKYNISKEETKKSIELIKSLNPKPVEFDSDDKIAYVYPDVLVEKKGSKYIAKPYNEKRMSLNINSYYSNLLIESDDEEVKSYIRENLTRAREFINEFDSRNTTIVNIANAILDFQNEYFDSDELKPMTLSDIAEVLECHVSTISRGVNDKYMLTPKGLLEFKFFFSKAFQRGDGEVISTSSIKQEIKKIIDAEDSSKPLSDSRIEKILHQRGYDIARRTVSKYREELGYLSSTMRKKVK